MEVDLRKANELFHDVESNRYDSKWGIRYDMENAERVRRKIEMALGAEMPRVETLLEVGCGTGYVGLNLCLYEGLVGEYYACDISQGMVEACRENAARIGVPVKASRCELERLVYNDCSFDMVIGHAILHHIPEIKDAFAEIFRVLRPGGLCVLAGEPTVVGDRMGRFARNATSRAIRLYARAGGYFGGVPARMKPPQQHSEMDHEALEYEGIVDIHTFWPPRVCRVARSVGFSEARAEGEEFLSSFVGWMTRTIDNSLDEENLTFRWRYWSYKTYLKLCAVDSHLYGRLPPWSFYNMLLFLRKPG